MTFSYSGDPSTSDLDAVRFLIPDKVSPGHRIENEEIDFLLDPAKGDFGGPVHAAAICAEQIAGQFADEADKRIGDLSISASQRSKAFMDRAKALRRMIGTDLADILVGGLTFSEKETLADNDDAVQPAFSIGQDDYPGNETFVHVPHKLGGTS